VHLRQDTVDPLLPAGILDFSVAVGKEWHSCSNIVGIGCAACPFSKLEGAEPRSRFGRPCLIIASLSLLLRLIQVACDVARQWQLRKFNGLVDSLFRAGAVANTQFSADAAVWEQAMWKEARAALRDEVDESSTNRLAPYILKMRDCIDRLSHHMMLNRLTGRDELYDAIEDRAEKNNGTQPVGSPDWVCTVLPVDIVGALTLWLGYLVVDRILLNDQAAMRATERTKRVRDVAAADGGNELITQGRGPAGVSQGTRLAAAFIEAARSKEGSRRLLSGQELRQATRSKHVSLCFALQVLTEMGEAGMLESVMRAAEADVDAGALPVAPTQDGSVGGAQAGRKRRRVLPQEPQTSMVPWSASRAAVSWIRKFGNDALPDVIVAPEEAWRTDSSLTADVRSWLALTKGQRASALQKHAGR